MWSSFPHKFCVGASPTYLERRSVEIKKCAMWWLIGGWEWPSLGPGHIWDKTWLTWVRFIYIYIFMHVYIYIYTYIHSIYIIYLYMYIYIYVYLDTFVYIYIHIFTYASWCQPSHELVYKPY